MGITFWFTASKIVLVMAVLALMTLEGTRACQCPSCNYKTSVQNCQCCIFRQLGKRYGPVSLPFYTLPSHPLLSRSKTPFNAVVTSESVNVIKPTRDASLMPKVG